MKPFILSFAMLSMVCATATSELAFARGGSAGHPEVSIPAAPLAAPRVSIPATPLPMRRVRIPAAVQDSPALAAAAPHFQRSTGVRQDRCGLALLRQVSASTVVPPLPASGTLLEFRTSEVRMRVSGSSL
jgi:hypothetical protein